MTRRLAYAERRFLARSYPVGPRAVRWGVYDRATGSWPLFRPDLGAVIQAATTRAEAQTEADRCEAVTREGAKP